MNGHKFLSRYIVERQLQEATEWLPLFHNFPSLKKACEVQIEACTRLLSLMDDKEKVKDGREETGVVSSQGIES